MRVRILDIEYGNSELEKSNFFITNLIHKLLVYLHIIHSFLTGAQDSHLQRVTIPETAYVQLRRGPPEDEQGMLETCRGF
jgi:hypothetical protein